MWRPGGQTWRCDTGCVHKITTHTPIMYNYSYLVKWYVFKERFSYGIIKVFCPFVMCAISNKSLVVFTDALSGP